MSASYMKYLASYSPLLKEGLVTWAHPLLTVWHTEQAAGQNDKLPLTCMHYYMLVYDVIGVLMAVIGKPYTIMYMHQPV